MDEWLKKLSLFRGNWLILLFSVGLILVGAGVFFYKSGALEPSTKVEIINETSDKEITVEIAGEVVNPGVYKLPLGSRVDDLIIVGGGFSAGADREGVEKYLNRAAKLTDGQKVYIPKQSDVLSAKEAAGDQNISTTFSSDSNGMINVNTASLSELDKLPGIGPVYGQSIIDHRPYSTVDEMVSKGAIKQSVYEKIKNMVSVY